MRIVELIRINVTRLLVKAARLTRSGFLLYVSSKAAGESPKARALITYAAIRFFKPSHCFIGDVLFHINSQPVSNVIRPLVHSKDSPTIRSISSISRAIKTESPALQYASAILSRRFNDAYTIWNSFSEVEICLNSLPDSKPHSRSTSIAVVLPGSVTDQFGKEIDSHDLVGRVGVLAPSEKTAGGLGRRFDIAFLNKGTYYDLAVKDGFTAIKANKIVTHPSCEKLRVKSAVRERIDFNFPLIALPTSDMAFIPLRIVPWCFLHGYQPTLYFADFYLGPKLYESGEYNYRNTLANSELVTLSYFQHDVFFCHAALRYWQQTEQIVAQGHLKGVLDLDGPSFAQALEERWR